MISRSAMAKRSSSRSRRESWQPSQEVNFHTASLGMRPAISDLPLFEPILDAAVRENRPVLADEQRPQLAVAAQTHAALHVALQGNKNGILTDAPVQELLDCEAHHQARS